ncbi:hypothetical protein, partial [Pseudomonas fluorescens]|uniref:hypothetical protein n=1 Tax=Pseudomonas fluorescens TaxID=294 RepID=UPI001C8385E8
DELPDCSIPRLCGGILQRIAGLSTFNPDKTVEVQSVSDFFRCLKQAAGQVGQGFELYWRMLFD